MIAFIVVCIFVSPLILGPLIIPAMYTHREEMTLLRLQEPVLKDVEIGYHVFRDRDWIDDKCDQRFSISCSERVCEGKLVDIEEHFVTVMKEAGKDMRSGPVVVCIGMLCLRCGYFNSRGRMSYLFKKAYFQAKTAEDFINLLEIRRAEIDGKSHLPKFHKRAIAYLKTTLQ